MSCAVEELELAQEDFRIVRIVNKAKRGDQHAFNKLLKMVEPDLRKLANHFFIAGADKEDVMQELRLGVVKAVNSYDSTKDTSFKNFCVTTLITRTAILLHANQMQDQHASSAQDSNARH